MPRRETCHVYNLYESIYLPTYLPTGVCVCLCVCTCVENEKVKLILITGNPIIYHNVLRELTKSVLILVVLVSPPWWHRW